jgi:hypothetical protein
LPKRRFQAMERSQISTKHSGSSGWYTRPLISDPSPLGAVVGDGTWVDGNQRRRNTLRFVGNA